MIGSDENGDSGRMLTVVTAVLAAVFLLSGGAKLLALQFEVEAFARWGYPLWFMYITGAVEVSGAICLLRTRSSGVAAAVLTGLMTGALLTHAVHLEFAMAALAAVIWAGTATIAYRRREQLAGLIGRYRRVVA